MFFGLNWGFKIYIYIYMFMLNWNKGGNMFLIKKRGQKDG